MHRFTPHIIYQKSKVDIVAVIVFAAATILQIIAVASPGWVRTPDVLIGLFHYCGKLTLDHRTPSMRDCEHIPDMSALGTLHTVQILALVSVLLAGVSNLLLVCHMWMIRQYEKITATVIILCLSFVFLSVLVSILCCVIFGASTRSALPKLDPLNDYGQYRFYYSFALYVAGGAILLLGAVLVIARVRKLTRMLLV